ncbi:magnesium/cobalt transporter CorA [Candidatus Woesearchaeota archaeon]|nr:magnesium/cobalt transporter CorA [Candidatus Woesearchaeota archaeon]
MIDLFYLDGELKRADLKDLATLKDKKLWLDVTAITKDEAEQLKNILQLHPLTVEDLVKQNTRIKIEEFPDYLLCVFYGLRKNRSVELVELDIVINQTFLITNHLNEIPSFTRLKNAPDQLEPLLTKGPDFLLHKILDMEIDNFFPVLEELDDQIEQIEELVTKKPEPVLLTKILQLKRKIVLIKKVVIPQREKLSFLAKNEYRFITKKALPYFRDVYDHSIRVADTVDNYREAIGSTFDAYLSATSHNLNEIMKVLSIIATIALPLTVISGIYGTNFVVLPGANTSYGFWVMVGAMALLVTFMISLFRKRGWF